MAYPSRILNVRDCSPFSVTITAPSVSTPSTSKIKVLICFSLDKNDSIFLDYTDYFVDFTDLGLVKSICRVFILIIYQISIGLHNKTKERFCKYLSYGQFE